MRADEAYRPEWNRPAASGQEEADEWDWEDDGPDQGVYRHDGGLGDGSFLWGSKGS